MESLERPSRSDMLMQVAHVISQRSTCNRLKVGALICRDGRVLATGYNGPPSKLPHCQHENGTQCDDAVHAESNAIAFAARYGVAVEGAEMYVTDSPCVNCAKIVINAGLSSVYYNSPYRDPSGILLLTRANVSCLRFLGDENFEFWSGDEKPSR